MALSALLVLTKTSLYGAILLAAGIAFHRQLGIAHNTKLLVPLGAIILTAVLLRFLLMTVQLGGGLGEPVDWSMAPFIWQAGQAQILVFLIGACGLVLTRFFSFSQLSLGSAAVLVTGFGLGGHTQGVDDPFLSPPTVIIHVGLAAFWIAAPWTLFPRAGAPPGDLSARLVRFSAIAVWAVPAAFLLGLGLLLRLAGGLEAVFATGYGQFLLLKLILATGALGLGAYNKRVVTERILADPETGTKLLKRVLASEAVLFALVLIVVSLATTVTGPDR